MKACEQASAAVWCLVSGALAAAGCKEDADDGQAEFEASSAASRQAAIAAGLGVSAESATRELDYWITQLNSPRPFDGPTYQAWLTTMNTRVADVLLRAAETVKELRDEETKLEGLEATRRASPLGLDLSAVEGRQQALLGEILVAGVFLAGVYASLLNFGRTVQVRVKTIEDKVAREKAGGKMEAQALAATLPDVRKATGDTLRDVMTYIATNNPISMKARDALQGEVLPDCAGIVLDLRDARNELIEARGKAKVLGKRKGSAAPLRPRVVAQQAADVEQIYLGTSTDQTFRGLPPGEWDFMVFMSGYVRGTAASASVNGTCQAPGPLPVTLRQPLELLGKTPAPAPPPPGPARPDAGAPAGSSPFVIAGYGNTDGTMGTDGARAQIRLSGAPATPAIAWTFPGATSLFVQEAGTETVLYGVIRQNNKDGVFVPLSSPVTYGDYGLPDIQVYPRALRPSPPLMAGGRRYIVGITTNVPAAPHATLLFTLR